MLVKKKILDLKNSESILFSGPGIVKRLPRKLKKSIVSNPDQFVEKFNRRNIRHQVKAAHLFKSKKQLVDSFKNQLLLPEDLF